jgi:hypothetical protein
VNEIEKLESGDLALVAFYKCGSYESVDPIAVVNLAKLGQATKRYIAELAEHHKTSTNDDEFYPCLDLLYDAEGCEGCKLAEICGLIAEEK